MEQLNSFLSSQTTEPEMKWFVDVFSDVVEMFTPAFPPRLLKSDTLHALFCLLCFVNGLFLSFMIHFCSFLSSLYDKK